MKENIYKIIVADDETFVRERIVSKIPKNMGFEVVGQAANGSEALDLIELLKPNVVFTDIKMPFIDGIDLARTIRKQYPTIKIIFISGYSEFSYAKEAVSLNVVSYLSKPIDEAEVVESLSKVKTLLDEEYQTLYNQERLHSMYKKNLPSLIENRFNTLLNLAEITDDDLESFKTYNIDLNHGEFFVGFVEIKGTTSFLEIEQLRIFLMNLLDEEFSNFKAGFYFSRGYELIFIVNSEVLNASDIETWFNKIIIRKNEFSSIEVKIGVSEVFANFKRFSSYFRQAKKALSYGNYVSIGDVIYYSDISTRKTIQLQFNKDEINEITYTMKFKSDNDIKNLFSKMIKKTDMQKHYLFNKQYYIISLANIFIEFSQSLHVDISEILKTSIIKKLEMFADLRSMFEFLLDLSLKIRSTSIDRSQNKAHEVLQKVLSFIDANYYDAGISMEVVAAKYGVSISYLSFLFKKERKTTFNKYLIAKRIDHAKELLLYSSQKISDISSIVGYNDVYYFSYSFKKQTKKSPREYRNDQSN